MMCVVAEAAGWAADLETREFRRLEWHETREVARRRVAQRTGVSVATLKRLRGDPSHWPRDIMASAYRALRQAYEHECERARRIADRAEEWADAGTGSAVVARGASDRSRSVASDRSEG